MREPSYTCPDIDSIQGYIQTAEAEAKATYKDFYDMKVDDIRDSFSEILSSLDGLCGMLEDVRSANEALRDWGRELNDKVGELEAELSDL